MLRNKTRYYIAWLRSPSHVVSSRRSRVSRISRIRLPRSAVTLAVIQIQILPSIVIGSENN